MRILEGLPNGTLVYRLERWLVTPVGRVRLPYVPPNTIGKNDKSSFRLDIENEVGILHLFDNPNIEYNV